MGERAIVGLCGTKNSGKTTAAKHLKKIYGALILNFTGPLKKACQVLFGFHDNQLYGSLKQCMDPFLGVSARDMLQTLGTDIFRDNKAFAMENETIWIAKMRETIANVKDPWQDIVIDDVRFPDEAEFIRSIKGMIFEIKRPVQDIEFIEFDDEVIPPAPKEFCNGSAPAELASNPLFHALHHVVPGWMKKSEWDQSVMMAELDRELNLLPQKFPSLPWMGRGYIRSNLKDAKNVLYPDFMTFWMAMRQQTLLFHEPNQGYGNDTHVSERVDITPHEIIINDCPLESFQERVFAIIPFVHTREQREKAQGL